MADSTSSQNRVIEDIDVGKYLEILRRRKWWVILTTTAVVVTTLVAVLRMPDIYHSQTVILVDPQKVPDAFVPATVNTTAADRLATVRQEIMSPTRLKQLLEETGLYAADPIRRKAQPKQLWSRIIWRKWLSKAKCTQAKNSRRVQQSFSTPNCNKPKKAWSRRKQKWGGSKQPSLWICRNPNNFTWRL